MGTSYIPTNQVLNNTPYSQILLHENIQDSSVYISRHVNRLLKAIGNDLVLEGLELVQDPTFEGTFINFSLTPGLLIQDYTLIEINEQVDLSIDISPFDQDNGYIIIYTDFHHLDSSGENYLTFKIAYVLADGTELVAVNPWNSSRNRIILNRFSFMATEELAYSVTEETSDFTLIGSIYNLKGITNFTNYAFRLIYDHSSETDLYGVATNTKYGHVKVPLDSGIDIDNGIISIPDASTVVKGLTTFATEDEAILMESKTCSLTPDSVKHIILNLKDIEIQVVDPGITLGTALILS
jgi:hypothetical protein